MSRHAVIDLCGAERAGEGSPRYLERDAPFPFQGVDVPLTRTGDGRWTWTAEGDNHGVTWKLSGRWYYFEASF